MKTIHGIVHASSGGYVMASLNRFEKAEWRIHRLSEWNSQPVLNAVRLLNKNAALGIPVMWRRYGAGESEGDCLEAIRNVNGFWPCAHSAEAELIQNPVRLSVARIVSDDAFLATIPLNFRNPHPVSFVSAWYQEERCTFGVVVNRKLCGVFHFTPAEPEKFDVHIGRLQRYWNRVHPETPFPESVFAIASEGSREYFPPSIETVSVRQGDTAIARPEQIKAVGAALALTQESSPVFADQTPEASMRKWRGFFGTLAIMLVVVTTLAWMGIAAADYLVDGRLNRAENQYKQLITSNADIKELLESSNAVASQIMHYERQRERRTVWSKFLDDLGVHRPEGLFIERVGSQPFENDADVVQVALAGWSKGESAITRFMSALQQLPHVSKPELASMTRDTKRTRTTKFKILCTLKLVEK